MSRAGEAPIIEGFVAPGFEAVREAFHDNFVHGVERGAAFAVLRDGERLVDLHGGFADAGTDTGPEVPRWHDDTLVPVYSTTKGVVALALALLADEGRLDFDAPVIDYWPEFGAAGKAAVRVSELLSHQAGLVGLAEPVSLEDHYEHVALAARLAAAPPLWAPGTAVGYHPITWGVLAGELVRRITGASVGTLLRERLAAPLAADVHLGLAPSEHGRVAALIGPNRPWRQVPGITDAPSTGGEAGPFHALANENPVIRPFRDVASAAYRAAELPAANGHATALGLARLYAGIIRRQAPLVSAAAMARATEEVVGAEQDDLVLVGRRFRRSAAGFMLNLDGIYGPDERAFGHDGAGGSHAFADPVNGLAVAYVMNQMQVHPVADRRGRRLVEALYACL
ncbi:MAG TPA: serine hydrolase domain-containing protein [Pseudomonadales bacterium]|nr:serine hydrolase domain-containing protein [Pseudomonadales bacterium]